MNGVNHIILNFYFFKRTCFSKKHEFKIKIYPIKIIIIKFVNKIGYKQKSIYLLK